MTHGSLRTALGIFEKQVRSDEKYYDANTSWVDAAIVNRGELDIAGLDCREWGEYDVDAIDSDSEGNEDEPDIPHPNTRHAGSVDGGEKQKPGASPAAGRQGAKLRTAADVINRLRWCVF